MRQMLGLCAMLLLLSGCEGEISPEEQAERDERDIAMVEQANNVLPPIEEVTPEPILYPDIERYDLFGAACNYAPGTSLGTRVIAREVDAYVKIEGEMVRLAADPGSRELPLGTRSLYSGREYALRLRLMGDGEPSAQGRRGTTYDSEITLSDAHGRTVYEGEGLAECGG